jgi:hypothetical protein
MRWLTPSSSNNALWVWVPAFAGTTRDLRQTPKKLHSTILQGCPAAEKFLLAALGISMRMH